VFTFINGNIVESVTNRTHLSGESAAREDSMLTEIDPAREFGLIGF
jgi:hypothetical protein